jgi:hypothetical protein
MKCAKITRNRRENQEWRFCLQAASPPALGSCALCGSILNSLVFLLCRHFWTTTQLIKSLCRLFDSLEPCPTLFANPRSFSTYVYFRTREEISSKLLSLVFLLKIVLLCYLRSIMQTLVFLILSYALLNTLVFSRLSVPSRVCGGSQD